MHLKIITYMRETEKLNQGLIHAVNIVKRLDPSAECVIFTDKKRTFESDRNIRITNYIYPGTKYVRLLKLINEENDNCLYVSIDNDIIPEEKGFLHYLEKCVDKNVDFSWARLQAQNNQHFISCLVSVDKLLSHDTIRPLLWHLKVGLSIPGQCFIMRPLTFKNKLYEMDTFLDDLALGAYVNKHFNELNVYISKEVIGYEYPNEKFSGLCRQRKRWAKGYYQVLKASKGKTYHIKVLLHAAAYHMNWVLNWGIAFCLMNINIWSACIYIILNSLFITRRKPALIFRGIVYQFVFPFFHLVWLFHFIKGEHNYGNG